MSYQLLSEAECVARKEHWCIWCPEKIAPGDKYIREASIYDGDFQNHHWHPECLKAAKTTFGDSEEFPAHEHKRGTVEGCG